MDANISPLTITAARIASGLPYSGDEDLDIPALLNFWKKNKYPLAALTNSNGWRQIWNSAEFTAARDEQKKMLSSLRAEYMMVRERWTQAGIPCILLKSGGNVPSFPYLSDNLDILIKEEHESRARLILQELGYVELRNVEEKQKLLFRKFIDGKSVSAIHLHTRVGWGVGFLNEDSLWERSHVSEDDAAVCIPGNEDAALITLAHSFYENKELRLADIVKIRGCLHKSEIDWNYLEKVTGETGWLNGFRFCVLVYAYLEKMLWKENLVPGQIINKYQNELGRSPLVNRYYLKITRHTTLSIPFRISFFFSKMIFYQKILSDRRFSLKNRLSDSVRTLIRGIKLKAGIWPQASFLVSFSRTGGSGKTRQARVLSGSLAGCGLKTRYYRNRYGTAGQVVKLRNPLLCSTWLYLKAAGIILYNFRRVKLLLLRGRIVICDRYVYDVAAELQASIPRINKLDRLAIKLMLALSPKPDIAYLLDSPENVNARPDDTQAGNDYSSRRRREYIGLASRYHLRIKKTDGELNAGADEIAREATTQYYEKFPTFLNGLFLSNPDQVNRRSEKG